VISSVTTEPPNALANPTRCRGAMAARHYRRQWDDAPALRRDLPTTATAGCPLPPSGAVRHRPGRGAAHSAPKRSSA